MHRGAPPYNARFAHQLLPDAIALADTLARGTALEHHPIRFLSLSAGKDEYVYHLPDHHFIRCIKNRYEIPAWRVCGDFALLRVELMDEAMHTVGPVTGWPMIYRDNRWQKLDRSEDGHYSLAGNESFDLPPYAARCFNLDHHELLDQ